MSVIKNNKWTEYKIGDICIVGDGAHAKIKRQDKGIKYLTSKNVKDGKLDLSKVDFISPQDYEKYFKADSKALTKPQPQDVLFSIIGEPYLFQKSDLFGLSSSVSIIRPNASEIFPKYLYYWIKGHIFQNALYAIKGGVAQSYVSLEMIKSLPLNYPPLPIQRAIASILSNYDDLIENNNRRIKILEEMAKTVYQEWFVKYRFPNHENVKMIESELGLIPEGWQVKKVKDIVRRLKVGKKYKEKDVLNEGLIPVIDQSRNSVLGFHNQEADYKTSSDSPIIIFGDHTCKMQLMVEPFSVAENVVPFVSNENILVTYLYFLVESLVTTQEYKRHWTELMSKQVVTTTPYLMKEFSSFVIPIFKTINNLSKKNDNLRKTRDLLLPKLISGAIDVENLDINTERLAS